LQPERRLGATADREESQMKFGIFDHMDDSGVSPRQHFEDRLSLIEAYDRAGFYAYHLAEHHGTPLGMAPSPSVILAAVAQRTKRLRFGPLVYLLPLYHPVRLIEEICMLDQMSGGRLELGVGRGVSPIEVAFYGVDPAEGPRRFVEALKVIKQGLTSDTLTFDGDFYKFKDVPMILKPVQRPHPPLWYGVSRPDSVDGAALEGAHIVTLSAPGPARTLFDRYRGEWARLGRPIDKLPLRGIARHVVLAETDAAAVGTAERAYVRWLEHMELLWIRHGMKLPLSLPPQIGPLLEAGAAFAGTAAGFKTFVDEQIVATGANYVVCDVAFGDLSLKEAMRTVDLLAREVMPLLPD
jgi:alkanesulfonate monooxygenase SsuD/methylene tetrahydromethanopterin reductase-like flavin-dependent oxidoreductase (luciferase family)